MCALDMLSKTIFMLVEIGLMYSLPSGQCKIVYYNIKCKVMSQGPPSLTLPNYFWDNKMILINLFFKCFVIFGVYSLQEFVVNAKYGIKNYIMFSENSHLLKTALYGFVTCIWFGVNSICQCLH